MPTNNYPIQIFHTIPVICHQNFINIPLIFHWYVSPMIEGSLEVKLPTIWTGGKAEVGRVREEKSRREKIREEKE